MLNTSNFIISKDLTQFHIFSSVKLTLLLLCIIFFGENILKSQNYAVKPNYDKILYGSLITISATELWLTNKLNATPHHWTVNPIDKLAINQLNTNLAHSADATAGATMLLSSAMTLALPQNERWGYINNLTQNIWLTGNTVQLVKILVQRSRPYTNASGYQFTGNKDDNYSFFSGHSAITAAAATTALMYALRNNQTNTVKYLAYGAGVASLATATLRIFAGKHYPSDVLTGLLIGTGISIFNTQVHYVR